MRPENVLHLLVVDPAVENHIELLKDLPANFRVAVLDKTQDGLSQISQLLVQYGRLASVHILSHGLPGELWVGASPIDREVLQARAHELMQWSASLAPNAELFLYGCRIAEGDVGQAFVDFLAELTGMAIAASPTLTGSAALGGRWDLAYQTRPCQTPLPFSPMAQASYTGVLIPIFQNLLYGIEGSQIYSLSTSNGTATNVGQLTDANNNAITSFAIARESNQGFVYFIENAATNARVGYWNPADQTTTILSTIAAPPGSFVRMAQSQTDTIYAMNNGNTILYTVAAGTGVVTEFSNIANAAGNAVAFVGASGDMAFDPNNPNRLIISFAVGGSGELHLFEVDISRVDGANNPALEAVYIGSTGIISDGGIGSLAYGQDGQLYTSASVGGVDSLYRLQLTGNAANPIVTTLQGETGLNLNDFGSLPTPTPAIDLEIAAGGGLPSPVRAGQRISFRLTVSNTDPLFDVPGINLLSNLPSELINITWTSSVTTGTGTVTQGQTGNGPQIRSTMSLNAGSTVTFIVRATVAPGTPEDTRIQVVAQAQLPEGVNDSDPTDNTYTGNTIVIADGTVGECQPGIRRIGTAGSDQLRGTDGLDTLRGNSGSDTLRGLGCSDLVQGGFGNDVLFGDAGLDTLLGNAGNDVLWGGLNRDTLDGGAGQDTLEGNAGNDVLYGRAGRDRLVGGPGSDTLYGGIGADTSQGAGGNDLLIAGSGNDLGSGGAGNDTLRGGSGADQLVGGLGADRVFGELGNDQLWGEDGTDLLRGGAGADTLYGGFGSDTSFGDAGNDLLIAGPGNDLLFGGSENDVLRGANGADRLFGGTGSDSVFGGFDNDQLWGQEGDDVLRGGDGDDTLYGGFGDDTCTGGNGDDLLSAGEGNDSLLGGVGNDTLRGLDGADQLFGGVGDDRVFGGLGDDQLWGQDGNDLLRGGTGDDALYGGLGDDTCFGGDGNDFLIAGPGDDLLLGGAGNDILRGRDGADRLFGGIGDDRVFGGLGADQLWGQEGDDLLRGGAGDDTFYGGLGSDTCSGGDGNDFLSAGAGDDVLLGGAGSDSLRGLDGADQLLGGTGDDRVFGGQGDDQLSGQEGNDLLRGSVGDDSLYGGLGDDTCFGGDGNDLLIAGAGDDSLLGGAGNDSLRGLDGADQLFGGTGDDRVLGELGNDQLWGQGGNDLLEGGAGDDTLNGGFGDDTCFGDGGNDLLIGDTGSDFLFGGAGNDVLVGGAGQDTLQGGTGADTYVFSQARVTETAVDSQATASDEVLGFNQVEGDRFRVEFATSTLPSSFSNAGRVRGVSLLAAARSAFRDSDFVQAGEQIVAARQAVLFTWQQGTYLAINNLSPQLNVGGLGDQIINVTGITLKAGDANRGRLIVGDYFVGSTQA